MKTQTIQFLPEDTIWKSTEEQLRLFGVQDEIPVPIEQIIESMGIDIIPVPGLQRVHGINGYTSHDMSEIRVNEGMYKECEVRLRFTLAHELGHMTLHKFLFTDPLFSTEEEWKEFIGNGITGPDYQRLELHANMFAGFFLAPKAHLEKHFKLNIPSIIRDIDAAKSNGLRRSAYLSYAVSAMARILRPVFNLSEEAIEHCIRRDNLERLIP